MDNIYTHILYNNSLIEIFISVLDYVMFHVYTTQMLPDCTRIR